MAPQSIHHQSNDNNFGTPLFPAVQSLKQLLSPALTTVTSTITSILSPTSEKTAPTTDALLPRVIESNNNNNNDNNNRRSPRVSEVRGRFDVGTSLIKYWDGIPFSGKIASNTGRYYKVKYDDNDEEQLTHREVSKYVQQANKITYTDGWSNAYKGLIQQEEYLFHQAFNAVRDFEDKAFSITHPETGKPLEYRDLRKDPQFKPAWDLSGANESGRLVQGIGRNADGSQRVQGTNTIFFIHKNKNSAW
jgi:hypothetical protein